LFIRLLLFGKNTELKAGPIDCLGRATNAGFYATAVPQTYGTSGTRSFATNIGSWLVPGAICASLYLVLSLPLARVARRIEHRLKQA